MSVEVTKHFSERFHQRVANTKRVSIFANRAYCFGKPTSSFKNVSFAKEIRKKESETGSTARVYSNSIYWFCNNKAITVYPLPQHLHGRL